MIKMSCPNCGRRGNIPSEKVNTRLHCKKCDAVFHMDTAGKILLGDPDAVREDGGGRRSSMVIPTRKEGGKEGGKAEPVDPIGRLADVYLGLPRGLQIGVPVAALLGLLVWMGLRFDLIGPGPPVKVETLAEKIGLAAARGDASTVRSMCASGTESDAEAWSKAIHDLLTRAGGPDAGKHTMVVTEAVPHGDKSVTVNMVFAPTIDAKPQFAPVLANTAWARAKDGQAWYFHGTSSLSGLPGASGPGQAADAKAGSEAAEGLIP